MTFDYSGYDLKLIQVQRVQDGTDHLRTHIYKFFSSHTKYQYIIRAEHHSGDVFAIKFYCKKDKRSNYKYSKIINKGDCGNIIISCAKVIPLLLEQYPTASFAFAASRSVDVGNRIIEDFQQNQRYKLYCYMIPIKFGEKTFWHYAYDQISSYILHNKSANISKSEIENMFKNTYQNLYGINI